LGSSADFNYKVALASGLKSLQGGRLRQAEEQFRYLVQHFPSSDGGYRGLAKVLVEQEDRPAALRALLDGGAALAKADQRSAAIALYREAIALDPHDLAAHRRLAAALALSGEADAAAHEYVRYIKAAIDQGDSYRAQNESTYALERMPGNAELVEVAHAAGAAIPKPKESTADRQALMRSAFTGAAPEEPEHYTLPPVHSATSWSGSAESAGEAWAAPAAEGGDAWGASPAANSDGEPITADTDALAVEATAARYLAKGDPRGGEAAVEAARRYIAEGRMDAASDLLLQLIAAGIADHDAQRLLVDVAKSLGKRDLAKAKVQLLIVALKLDGRTELAAEVEQLARAF
jgi:thioredoxin-like negative regulator of GroEL